MKPSDIICRIIELLETSELSGNDFSTEIENREFEYIDAIKRTDREWRELNQTAPYAEVNNIWPIR